MGKRGFIAYDPELTRNKFNSDPIITIYYMKLLRYDQILTKDDEGLFTRSSKQIEEATCITHKQQYRVRRWLERQSFIVTTLKVPSGTTSPQVHFRIVDTKRPL